MDNNNARVVLKHLYYTRNDLVGYLVAVFLPVFTIFFTAAIIVTKGPVGKQNRQVDDIKVGSDQASVPCRKAPAKTGQNFGNVMEMSRDLPPTIQQKETLLGVSIGSCVLSDDPIGCLAPNLAISIRLTKDITLIVGIVIDQYTSSATQE
jgi:hypothetical protein